MAKEKRKQPTRNNSNAKKTKPDNSKENFESGMRSNKLKSRVRYFMEPTEENIGKENNKDNLKGNEANVVDSVHQLQRGILKHSTLKKIADKAYLQQLKYFHQCIMFETFNLRITSLKWHPSDSNLFVIGGKHGSVELYKISGNKMHEKCFFNGIGPGGTMEAMQFNTKRTDLEVCTASVDGTVSSYNFNKMIREPLISSDTPETRWFTSMAIHPEENMLFAGDNLGYITTYHLGSKSSTNVTKKHASKIKYMEFNPRDPNLLVTASLDHSVKLWDIRNNLAECVTSLKHVKGVASATFSRTDGCRLLTTDSHSQLRVYKAPFWTLEHSIEHPHRCFQHLTPIKASWHPLADLFLIGRYPDQELRNYENLRCVDVFSALSGKLLYEVVESSNKRLLTSLVEFNRTGTILATTSGRTINIWMKKSASCI